MTFGDNLIELDLSESKVNASQLNLLLVRCSRLQVFCFMRTISMFFYWTALLVGFMSH